MTKSETWNAERDLQELKQSPSVYHFEYQSIHNQRVALVRIIHLWHQIGFPVALGVFGWFYSLGKSG